MADPVNGVKGRPSTLVTIESVRKEFLEKRPENQPPRPVPRVDFGDATRVQISEDAKRLLDTNKFKSGEKLSEKSGEKAGFKLVRKNSS